MKISKERKEELLKEQEKRRLTKKEFEELYEERDDKKIVEKLGPKKVHFVTGIKRWFGIGPKYKTYKTFWQKGVSNSKSDFIKSPRFSPSDYIADNSLEAKKMAFEDAKNHEKFYKELVRQGVYPEGTKVKIRKMNKDGSKTRKDFINCDLSPNVKKI